MIGQRGSQHRELWNQLYRKVGVFFDTRRSPLCQWSFLRPLTEWVIQWYARNTTTIECSTNEVMHWRGQPSILCLSLPENQAKSSERMQVVQGLGFNSLPSNWIIDWRRFFEIHGQTPPHGVNKSRALDPFLASSLHTLPGEPAGRTANLAFRNLKRGVNLRLPSGQDVAAAMGIYPMQPDDVAKGPDGQVAAKHGLHERTPLWYYILKEAQILHGGLHLGPVGSTIVAETVVGILQGDENSFLRRRTDWRPEIDPNGSGDFTMADLLLFTNDISPIG